MKQMFGREIAWMSGKKFLQEAILNKDISG